MIKQTAVICAVILMGTSAWSAEKFGVAVYPGASDDVEATKIAKLPGGDSACFKIITPLAKVVDYYRKQPGIKPFVPPQGMQMAATVFQKGEHLQIRIQSLPANPQETDFCIAKAE
jgi:hypothetical protein